MKTLTLKLSTGVNRPEKCVFGLVFEGGRQVFCRQMVCKEVSPIFDHLLRGREDAVHALIFAA